MLNIVTALEGKEQFFHGNGASKEEIRKAEEELDLHFTKEYSDYLSEYGFASYVGHELTGIAPSARLNVIAATERLREQILTLPLNWYVIEETSMDDVVICQASSGEVYQVQPGGSVKELSGSFLEYILE